MCKAYYEYVLSDDVKLFTVVLLPEKQGKFPIVIYRSPYVDACENMAEDDIVAGELAARSGWLKSGYAVVYQHCRGRGKSEGDCIPYVNEARDGLNLRKWIRKQSFYGGELFLAGGSYGASVHYVTAPFEDDIKGAVFSVQDTNRYNVCYRNGFMKRGLHGDWYVGMYKAKSHMKKNYTRGSFNTLPLKNFTEIVFGEKVDDFESMLRSPKPDDEFWSTPEGGGMAKGITDNLKFPALFTTGFYDIYTGGIFDMWNNMSKDTKKRCALLVSPYSHGDNCDEENSIMFEDGSRREHFGNDYEIRWFDYIRGKCEPPCEPGKVSYYRLFENRWATDDFDVCEKEMKITLGEDEVTYVYNPYDAPTFKGGLSTAFGGAVFQNKPGIRHDIVSVYTKPFEKDVFVKGKMRGLLRVKSDCPDTCFYMRISIQKERGDYGLRDDITSLCYQLGDYRIGEYVNLSFSFDEHAFLIKSGERLRIDIASADNEHYVRHTNTKGLYSEQTFAVAARNTVCRGQSSIVLPIED